jgi:predicted glycogen debranching enzyme
LPNRFPDDGSDPEYNSVDAALWFVIAVGHLFDAYWRKGSSLPGGDIARFRQAIEDILSGYAEGTRHGIRLDQDGLISAGEPGQQLTWMDAKVGDWVVTPRIGKPVEIQALWLNALRIARYFSRRWDDMLAKGLESFNEKFWNTDGEYLYDVIDEDHRPGQVDRSFRPNQIFAAGGLPLNLLDPKRAKKVVDAVEAKLWTPLGLRTLAPMDSRYSPIYYGGQHERDGAYHQGTVWPWLLGPFVEAWVKSRGKLPSAKEEARKKFITPLLAHLSEAGIDHISEIADGAPPHTPRGCPFQAWSVGELLRLELEVLAP